MSLSKGGLERVELEQARAAVRALPPVKIEHVRRIRRDLVARLEEGPKHLPSIDTIGMSGIWLESARRKHEESFRRGVKNLIRLCDAVLSGKVELVSRREFLSEGKANEDN